MNFIHKLLILVRDLFKPGTGESKNDRTGLKTAVSLGLVFVLLAMLGIQVYRNWDDILSYPWKFDYKMILFAFLAYSLNLMATARVWASIMMRLAPVMGGSALTHVRLYAITNLVNRLPTPIPYVVARTEVYNTRGVSRATTLMGMALEIAVTMITGFLVAVVLLPYGYFFGGKVSGPEIALMGLVFLGVLVVILQPRFFILVLNKIFLRWKMQPANVDLNIRDTLRWILSFLPIWAMNGVMCYFLANSIYAVEWSQLLMFIQVFALAGVIGWISNFLFFIPNLGLRQLAAAYLLSNFLPVPVSVAIVILNRFAVMLFEGLWALFFGFILPKMTHVDGL